MSALAEIEVGPRRPPNVFNLAKSFPTDVHIPSISLFFEIKDQVVRFYVLNNLKEAFLLQLICFKDAFLPSC